MAKKKSTAVLEGEEYASTPDEETVIAQPAETTEIPEEGPDVKEEETAPQEVKPDRTIMVKITEEGREFNDLDGNCVTCGKSGEFDTAYGEMLIKLKVAEKA